MYRLPILKIKLLYVAIACVCATIAILNVYFVVHVRADNEQSLIVGYESSNVLDDLKGSTVGGREFSLDDYPIDANGKPQLISLAEFGYSYYADNTHANDYSLYVYIYNPTCRDIDKKSARNIIQIYDPNSDSYSKYPLAYLNHSTDETDKLFYKFRISFTYSERMYFINMLNSSARIYKISGFELSVNGDVTDYPCAQVYTYSGFAKGYGAEDSNNGSLTCKVDGFDTFVNLNVKSTYYRADGDFNEGVQTALDTVYFRIPNKFLNEFGALSEIDCEWYQYLTKPILVTSNQNAYSWANSLNGAPLSNNQDFYYLFLWLVSNPRSVLHYDVAATYFMSNCKNVDYNGDINWGDGGDSFLVGPSKYGYNNFASEFYCGKTDPTEYTVNGDLLRDSLLERSINNDEPKYLERYRTSLFVDNTVFSKLLNSDDESQVMGYNRKTITSDTTFPVVWDTKIKHWYWWLTDSYEIKSECRNVEAFHFVKKNELSGDTSAVSDTLLINELDIDDIKAEFELAEINDETLVLFRFNSTKYFGHPASVYSCKTTDDDPSETLVDGAVDILDNYLDGDSRCNAYIAQEVVYLDFDIISLTFTRDNVNTVIPVVASPIDIISDITPPLKIPQYESAFLKALKIILIVLIALLLVWLLSKFGLLKPIVNGIVWVVTAPFKAIGALFKRRRKRKDSVRQPPLPQNAEVKNTPDINVTVNIPDYKSADIKDKSHAKKRKRN